MTLQHLDQSWDEISSPSIGQDACCRKPGVWRFRPVYSSYIDLLGVSHGRMPCPRV